MANNTTLNPGAAGDVIASLDIGGVKHQVVALGASYETVDASQSDQTLGATTGATGDYLLGMTVTPLTTSPGAVAVKDGSGTAYTVFSGGANSVSNLVPFPIGWGAPSTAGAWKITTGTNVKVACFGKFT